MSWWKIRRPVPRTIAVVLGIVPVLFTLGLWWALTHGAAEEPARLAQAAQGTGRPPHPPRELAREGAGERVEL